MYDTKRSQTHSTSTHIVNIYFEVDMHYFTHIKMDTVDINRWFMKVTDTGIKTAQLKKYNY